MAIQYSDNSFRHFDEQRRRQEIARRASLEDPMERLARYTAERSAERILRFAELNDIDLKDPGVRQDVANLAEAIRAGSWAYAVDSEEVDWANLNPEENEWTDTWRFDRDF